MSSRFANSFKWGYVFLVCGHVALTAAECIATILILCTVWLIPYRLPYGTIAVAKILNIIDPASITLVFSGLLLLYLQELKKDLPHKMLLCCSTIIACILCVMIFLFVPAIQGQKNSTARTKRLLRQEAWRWGRIDRRNKGKIKGSDTFSNN